MALKDDVKQRSAEKSALTNKIAAIIGERGMHWKDVARILGVNPAAVSVKKKNDAWEIEDLIKLSRYFKTSFVIGGKYGV